MVQKIHGLVAKLVNGTLPKRRVPVFRNADHHDYFDGCPRHVLRAERTYRHIQIQSVRHKLVSDYRLYPNTKINIEFTRAIKRAVQLTAFLEEVPYFRYRQGRFSDFDRLSQS